jgi:hypothetical protein
MVFRCKVVSMYLFTYFGIFHIFFFIFI